MDSRLRTAAEFAGKTSANKIALIGAPGVGKTTFAAWAPDALIIPSAGQGSGISKLAEAGTIPATTTWTGELESDCEREWRKLTAMLCNLADKSPSPFKTIAIDCFDEGGAVHLAYLDYARKEFNGEMGEKGFMSYQKGYIGAVETIEQITLGPLEKLVEAGVDVILIMHANHTTFKNPEGLDYGVIRPNLNEKNAWASIKRWADVVMYMDYETAVIGDDGPGGKAPKKGKAVVGNRVLRCARTAACDAKNRIGLPDTIVLPEDYSLTYKAFKDAIGTKNKGEA